MPIRQYRYEDMMSENIHQDLSIEGEGNIVVGKGDVLINPLPPAEARLRHDLGILLKNVETTWIKGVLEKSVHQAALLDLGIELWDDAVNNPWRMVMEAPGQARETVPAGKRIKDIFTEANGLLLILGEPGSGKTTTLLQLARDLMAEVDKSFTEAIPVILNLSTWNDRQQPLDKWLIAELNSKYFLPKKQGQRWLKERRILPLLDGLDEVRPKNRAACVEKINQLQIDYGLQGLVVCSRVKEYTDLKVRLAFYRAVYIQPLTFDQIDEYLDRAGEKLASLRATLHTTHDLLNIAKYPLILNIMSLSYQDAFATDLSVTKLTTEEFHRRHLFDTYIARMLRRRGILQPYNDERVEQYLSWLARNMQKHGQEVFFLENLQPDWLQGYIKQWLYTFISRLICGLIVSVILIGMPWGLILGISIGLSIGIIDILKFEWLRRRKATRKVHLLLGSVINIAVVGLVVGPIFSLIYRLAAEQGDASGPPLYLGLFSGLILGLIFGSRGSRQRLDHDIQTFEAVHWSWRKAIKGGLIGMLGGLLLSGVINILNVLSSSTILISRANAWYFVLQDLFFFSMFIGLLCVILSGFSKEIVETKLLPNQGIRLSIRNAIFVGLAVGLVFGLIYGLVIDPNSSEKLRLSLIFGLLVAFITAWSYGGFDVIRHYTMRFILILQGNTPVSYAHFLDYAVDRVMLQKVGGGYRFIHRLLLEHFAQMAEPKDNLHSP